MKSTPRVQKETSVSVSPSGEAFPLPKPEDYPKEFKRIQKLVAKNRKEGREIVVVMGVGFVGAVMAGVIADSEMKKDSHEPPPALRATSSSGGQKESCPPLECAGGGGHLCPPLEGVGGGISSSLVARRSSLSSPSPIASGPSLMSPAGGGAGGGVLSPIASGPSPLYPKFVIGVQRPSVRSYWKIPYLNRGIAPVEAEDPEVAPLIARCVNEKKTLIATYTEDALTLADCVVVDVQCDYHKETLGNCRQGYADIKALEDSLKIIGEKIPKDCLVLIETTVPPGTTEYIAYPILKKAFDRRFSTPSNKKVTKNPSPSTVTLSASKGVKGGAATSGHELRAMSYEPLLAHSYERVMPGREYVASIRDFWRVCSGINEESRRRVAKFLSEVLNVEKYPLTVLDRPVESETCKIVENSYRATILAFLDEWSLFAERNGVDLIKVIKAIKIRPTHSNMLFPGPGVGGYCLPKDGGLGVWAYKKLMGFEDEIFKITPLAIDINDTRSLHAAELVRDALRNMGKIVAASRIAVLGASYREDVGDTRYSGSEILVRKLTEMGGDVVVHDPYVKGWAELEKQEKYPYVDNSWSRFFRNQEKLSETKIQSNIAIALKGVDAVVLAVRHQAYLKLEPEKVVKMTGRPIAIIDCFGILDDAAIRRYFELGCEVKGLGRGHVKRIKDSIRE